MSSQDKTPGARTSGNSYALRTKRLSLSAISDKWKKLAKAVGSAIARAAIEPDPLITQLVNPKEYPTDGW